MDLAFDKRTDLIARLFGGGDIGDLFDRRFDLLVGLFLEQRDSVVREHLAKRRLGIYKIIDPSPDEIADVVLERFGFNSSVDPLVKKRGDLGKRLVVDDLGNTFAEDIINAPSNKTVNGRERFLAS